MVLFDVIAWMLALNDLIRANMMVVSNVRRRMMNAISSIGTDTASEQRRDAEEARNEESQFREESCFLADNNNCSQNQRHEGRKIEFQSKQKWQHEFPHHNSSFQRRRRKRWMKDEKRQRSLQKLNEIC